MSDKTRKWINADSASGTWVAWERKQGNKMWQRLSTLPGFLSHPLKSSWSSRSAPYDTGGRRWTEMWGLILVFLVPSVHWWINSFFIRFLGVYSVPHIILGMGYREVKWNRCHLYSREVQGLMHNTCHSVSISLSIRIRILELWELDLELELLEL